MNKRYSSTVLVLTGLVCFSCSSTHWVYNDQRCFDQFNAKMLGVSVKIEKNDGSLINTDYFWVDSSNLYIASDDSEFELTIDEVKQINYTDHAQGALNGALIGAGSGALALLLASSNESNEGFISFSPGAYALFGAILGVFPGALIGAASGHTTHYQFSTDLPPEDWLAKVNTPTWVLNEPELVKVEVQSAERTASGLIFIRWKGKAIRLSDSDVDKIERSRDKTYIWIWDDIYESEFNPRILTN